MPLPTLFRRWYGPIPPISRVLNQTGDWDAVGQTRTVALTEGGSIREELTHIDAPYSFTLSVTWRWTLYPRCRLAARALPVFGRLWRGYARQALEELSNLLVR
jgi:hypothetical protein